MPQLDPRRQPIRLTPMLFVSGTALVVGTLLWRVFQPLGTKPATVSGVQQGHTAHDAILHF